MKHKRRWEERDENVGRNKQISRILWLRANKAQIIHKNKIIQQIPGHYKKKVVGLERGPLSLVSTTEKLLDRKVAAPV
jgi:hypothetical protein